MQLIQQLSDRKNSNIFLLMTKVIVFFNFLPLSIFRVMYQYYDEFTSIDHLLERSPNMRKVGARKEDRPGRVSSLCDDKKLLYLRTLIISYIKIISCVAYHSKLTKYRFNLIS